MSLPLPLGAVAAGSPGLLWQVALTRWAARQLAVSLSASPGQRTAQDTILWRWSMSRNPADRRPLGLLAKDTLPLAKVPCKVAHWHFPLAPGRWRIDPLLHGSADKDNCAAAELNAMYHGQSNTHMATHLRLMPFPMANCTVEVSTASATQSPLANAQHKHANKTHVQRNWGEGSTSNAKNKTHANANANANGNV